MELRIDLLRHGETTLSHTLRGSTDDALTKLGWQQMQDTIAKHSLGNLGQGQSLIQQQWDFIFSSPLQRCAKFAEKLVDEMQIQCTFDQRLQEMHFGDWEGISTQQLFEENPELLANFWQFPTQFSPPNAEKLGNFQQRIRDVLTDIAVKMKQSNAQTALIVSHGGVIKLLKCIALQQSLDDILKMSAELGQLNRFILESETMQLTLLEDDK